jgi:hypothetical protein
MNIIDTSLITDPSKQQPFLGGSLAFLQNASKEIVTGICRGIMGEGNYTLTTIYGVIISGCKITGAGATISSGYIYFDGEIYYFAGQTGMLAYSNVPVFTALNSYISPDPITFSDNSTGSVHQQRRLQIVDAVSGTGLFDLANIITPFLKTQIIVSTFTTSSGSEQDVTGATFTTPSTGTRNYKITFTGDNYGAAATVTVTGATYKLKQAGSTVHTINPTGITGDGATAARIPVAMVKILTDVPASTIIKITATRNTSGNQTIENGNFIIEELS